MKINLIGKFSVVALGAAVLLNLAPTALAAAQFNTASGDRPTLQVVNATTSPNTNYAWSNSATVNAGDVLNFYVFYHNTGDTTATNTRLKINVPASISNGSLSVTGYVTSDNTSQVNGNTSVTYNGSGSQSLTYVNGSAKWYTGPSSVWTSIPSGQTGDEAVNSTNGLNIGSVPVGSSGYLVVKVQVGTNNTNTNTGSAPYVATASYTNLIQSSVTLNGSVNPNGSSTTAWFEYGTSNSLGQTSSIFSVGNANFQTSVSSSILNLNSNSTYFYRAVAQNAYGTSQGSIFSFSTGSTYVPPTGNSPLVTTSSANLISSNGATLYGSINPNNTYTTAWFEYGQSTSLGNTTSTQTIGSGNSYITTTAGVYNLNANTTYYYRAVAQNSFGNAYGSILSFTTQGNTSNTTVVTNNQDLSGLSNSLSQLNLALSGLVRTVANRPATNTQTIVERVVQVTSAGNGLAKLTLTADKDALKSGDAVVITAEIDALTDINKASLQINLDPSLVFDSSIASVFNKNGNIITYSLGNIAANSVTTVKINAHLSKDADISKVTKVTTTGTLNYSDSAGTVMAPLFPSLDVNVGGSSLFASIFGAFGWGSGLTILLIALLILLIAIAVRRLMV